MRSILKQNRFNKEFMMKKAIVTGANGFIGSKLINELCSKDYFVYAIVKDKNENISYLPKVDNIQIVYCDLQQILELEHLIVSDTPIDVFFHLAWIGVSTSYKNDFAIQFQNISYAYNAICVADALGCLKFVSTGSLSECAYAGGAVDGSERPSPSDFYSCAKIAARYFCMLYAEKHDININWCLITSLYGPGRLDNNILTYTILALLKGEDTEYTKLEQRWDYTYIDDLISALILVGEKGKNREIYSIGSGENRVLKEYVEVIYRILAPEKELVVGQKPYKTSGIDNSIADISKITRDTGYHPSVCFETGIERTIDFLKEYLKTVV